MTPDQAILTLTETLLTDQEKRHAALLNDLPQLRRWRTIDNLNPSTRDSGSANNRPERDK